MTDLHLLIDRIYEASADPDLWPEVLHALAGEVDAAGGIILTRRADSWVGWRHSAALEGVSSYLQSPAVMKSQATDRLLAANRAGFVDSEEVFTEEEWLADPLMTEWGTAIGLHHATATAIPMPTNDMVVVQLNRRIGEPRFDPESIARLDAFRPHLARAGLLAARWRLERLRAAAEALALIGLPAAVLDARGEVLAANALIEAMDSHLVWLPRNRVALHDAAANALLRRAIAGVADPAAAPVRSFPSRGTDGRPVVVHLIPTTGRARDLFEGGFGVLTLTPVAAPCAPDAALIRGLFDLTAAEARVACGVAEGSSPEQIADRCGVARETVRHHLKTVFVKTGVSRQSQLAALLAAQPRIPLGPDEGSD